MGIFIEKTKLNLPTHRSTQNATIKKAKEQIETTNVVNSKIHCVFLTISSPWIMLDLVNVYFAILNFMTIWYQHFD